METLKYTIIRTAAQYKRYCDMLEVLVESGKKSRSVRDEIDLLTLLIEKYDAEHNSFTDTDPIALLRALMKENTMKAVDLAKLLDVSEGLVSDILHYKKGLSKESIRILSAHFKLSQEAFNRPYALKLPLKSATKKSGKLKRRVGLVTA